MKTTATKKSGVKKLADGLELDPRRADFARNFALAAKAFTRKATRSRKAVRAVLVSEGIVTPTGKLTKNYR